MGLVISQTDETRPQRRDPVNLQTTGVVCFRYSQPSELLVSNSSVWSATRVLRTLLCFTALDLFVRGHTKRDDRLDIPLFQWEVNTGFAEVGRCLY